MGWKEMAGQREGREGGAGSADDGEFCVGGGGDRTRRSWRYTLLAVIPASFQLPQRPLPKKPQGRSVAVGFPLLRGKGCFQVPPGVLGRRANHAVMAEAGAGGRA